MSTKKQVILEGNGYEHIVFQSKNDVEKEQQEHQHQIMVQIPSTCCVMDWDPQEQLFCHLMTCRCCCGSSKTSVSCCCCCIYEHHGMPRYCSSSLLHQPQSSLPLWLTQYKPITKGTVQVSALIISSHHSLVTTPTFQFKNIYIFDSDNAKIKRLI